MKAIAQRFSTLIEGSHPPKPVRRVKDYVGTYVYFPTPAGDRCAWIYLTAANCRYNVLGYPDAAIIEIRKHGNALLEPELTSSLLATEFELHTDLTGFKTPRQITPLESVDAMETGDAGRLSLTLRSRHSFKAD